MAAFLCLHNYTGDNQAQHHRQWSISRNEVCAKLMSECLPFLHFNARVRFQTVIGAQEDSRFKYLCADIHALQGLENQRALDVDMIEVSTIQGRDFDAALGM